jgi:hypothetical protein
MTVQVPKFDEMMQAVIDILKPVDKGMALDQLRPLVAKTLSLTNEQLSILHSPEANDRQTKFEYNLAWTLTYLKNAGLVVNQKRGHWTITQEGKNSKTVNPEEIKRSVRTYKNNKNGVSIAVTIPSLQDDEEPETQTIELSDHTRIQWLLLKLGQDMGLQVWIANNDRTKEFNGEKFALQPRILTKLPQRFDEATQKTVELIDVLWIEGQAIKAAFEIEHTSSVYSGLLRLSDLLSMQPDIDIPMYIVSPDEREQKVMREMNRPTFSKATPLVEKCLFLSYSKLEEVFEKYKHDAEFIKPEIIRKYGKSLRN